MGDREDSLAIYSKYSLKELLKERFRGSFDPIIEEVIFERIKTENKKISLNEEELTTIYADQNCMLKSLHRGDLMCGDLSICPPEHFGNGDIEDIFLRQGIMSKIQEV